MKKAALIVASGVVALLALALTLERLKDEAWQACQTPGMPLWVCKMADEACRLKNICAGQ